MEFFADWHTHSTYSDGRGTIEENARAAMARGLEQLGVTDHGPRNIGAGVRSAATYRQIKAEVAALNAKYPAITLKTGAEADIIDADGTIDLPAQVAEELDILIVGLHPYIWPQTVGAAWSVMGLNHLAQISGSMREKARNVNTKSLKEALCKYNVSFISHPDLKMPVDIEELAAACADAGTAMEINTGHHYDKEELVRMADKKGVDFVVNSDAHFPKTVGNLESGMLLMEKFNIPAERILNARETRH